MIWYTVCLVFNNAENVLTFVHVCVCATGHQEALPAGSGVGDREHGGSPERLHVPRANCVLCQSFL